MEENLEEKTKGRIFLLEDVGIIQKLVYSCLEGEGYVVDRHDGKEFVTSETAKDEADEKKSILIKPIEAIFAGNYVLAVMDIDIKGDSRGGINLLRAMRMYKKTKQMPVLMTTRFNDEKIVAEVAKYGPPKYGKLGYLIKGRGMNFREIIERTNSMLDYK